jgi:phosphate/sulfate permease
MIFEIVIFWIIVPIVEFVLEVLIAKPISKLLKSNKYTEKLLFNKTDGILLTGLKSLLLVFAFIGPIILTLMIIYS